MKALASDFDGTLFFENIEGQFKKEDLKAIENFQKEGHLFGICTGRPLIGIQKVVGDLIHFDFYIISSGAAILDQHLQVIDQQCISRKVMKDLYDDYHQETKVFIQANHVIYTFEKGNVPIQQNMISSLDEIEGDMIFGLSLQARDEDHAYQLSQDIKEKYKSVDAFQNKEFIDIVKRGCSKGKAIETLKEKMHLKEVAGIGDSYNDIPMLDVVDDAFTFTYSPKIVQEKADHIVDSLKDAIEILVNKY